jgi:hypothetical protein
MGVGIGCARTARVHFGEKDIVCNFDLRVAKIPKFCKLDEAGCSLTREVIRAVYGLVELVSVGVSPGIEVDSNYLFQVMDFTTFSGCYSRSSITGLCVKQFEVAHSGVSVAASGQSQNNQCYNVILQSPVQQVIQIVPAQSLLKLL